MIFIAHRGNIKGSDLKRENTISYIEEAIEKNFQVEIDLWREDNNFYLGHNKPMHIIDSYDLLKMKNFLWCHAKNIDALYILHQLRLNCFFHNNDDVTLTSWGFLWTYPGKKLTDRSVCINPKEDVQNVKRAHAICDDYIMDIREKWQINNG